MANIIIGIIGAVVGGFIARSLFGNDAGTNGLFVSFLVALMGASASMRRTSSAATSLPAGVSYGK